jgi:uncharacterized protein (DUF924 family)
MTIRPREIVDFWLAAGREKWWTKNDAFDAEVRRRFGALHAEACAGRHNGWCEAPEGSLALVIVLDQFSRNLYRADHRAWANDQKALAIARQAIERGHDLAFEPEARQWFYLPFMHAEALDAQRLCVQYIANRVGDPESVQFAELHLDIIRRFGRFPHRNALLGRVTTPEEQTFLDAGGFAG